MAKATFSLDKFVSQIRSGSLARTNRFEVVITAPPGLSQEQASKASLLVESANLPMVSIASKSFKIFGPSYQRPYTSEYGGEGIPITFHVDRDMIVKKFFDSWTEKIINPTNFTTAYQSEYTATIYISQLDEQNNITYTAEIIDAFPRNINLMDLNNASSNQTHRLNVLFAYRYWRPLPRIEQPVVVPRPVINPEIPSVVTKPIFDRQTAIGTLDENGNFTGDISGP